eukprot:3955586-Pyramimonas_sp.AAC.1
MSRQDAQTARKRIALEDPSKDGEEEATGAVGANGGSHNVVGADRIHQGLRGAPLGQDLPEPR